MKKCILLILIVIGLTSCATQKNINSEASEYLALKQKEAVHPYPDALDLTKKK